MTRALKPEHIIETGTDKGLGSCVLAAALRRNGRGRLTTFDVSATSGYLVSGDLERFVDRRIEPSVDGIPKLASEVDLFLHDSLHTADYEAREYQAVAPLLSRGAVVLSDNAHVTNALASWAETVGRSFLYFAEQPADHWYPGGGIGVAFPDQSGPSARPSVA
jgi:predicted O-methyltransferase YrrM